MKVMEVCFVGIGSIAKRHIRNLKVIAKNKNIDLQIDAIRRARNRDEETDELGIRNIYCSYKELQRMYDIVFVTNPTKLHIVTIENMRAYGKYFFVEKPIVTQEQVDAVRELLGQDGPQYYVACPLRYNAVIQYLKNYIDPKEVISVRSISSSYLPDWRPGIDYRSTYSAQRELGGGVSIDLIHEWDYLTYLFGNPQKVKAIIAKKSNLEIDSDDLAIYIAEYQDKVVELHLDYFGRKTLREIVLIMTDDTIVGDIVNSRITFLKSGETLDFNEDRDAYQIRELEHFWDIVEGKCINDNSAAHAISVLKFSQGEA